MSDWTEIICILDRSGSMGGLENDTMGGFNAFVAKQREEEGRARLTLVLFDHEVERVWEKLDVAGVPPLDKRLYFVRGSTALLDAVGQTVNDTKGRIEASHEAERPANVIVLVITDGEENASKEYDKAGVQKLVEQTQADGWEYVFLGAEIDAFGAAREMSMAAGSTSVVPKSAEGMREAYSKLNRAVSNVRRTGTKGNVNETLSDEDKI